MRTLLAALTMLPIFASTGRADDWTDCTQQTNLDLSISGCSNVIAAGRSAYVAIAYYDRALTHARKGDHDLAVADFDKAIELSPKDARFYYGRGAFYSAGNAEGKRIYRSI